METNPGGPGHNHHLRVPTSDRVIKTHVITVNTSGVFLLPGKLYRQALNPRIGPATPRHATQCRSQLSTFVRRFIPSVNPISRHGVGANSENVAISCNQLCERMERVGSLGRAEKSRADPTVSPDCVTRAFHCDVIVQNR
ncbi:hypothetical protein EVAR_24559_1 [Eumeta japonica]|uniref:Uncharacterized protein n=1 Tax=Eumeta variegata TaxID=151549 RepID=A0A4C1UQY4_EUMVA|nr:hypothetical protein EVAR_24559_1 [Eumeta japonica]